jgi:hypothetical protein
MTPEQAAILRKPFEPQQIGKLPKPYKKDSPKSNCRECGGYHGQPAVHLDYVGHAATTDRLLQVDPEWSWEPMAYDMGGLPLFDGNRNLWIKLTVCGVTRIGVGDGLGLKECIGDAIRNAAMRFGVALDLWAKEDLHTAAVERGSEATSEAPSPDLIDPKGKQMKAIHAGMGEAGLGERVAGLAFLSEVTGRDVTTSKTLTKAEAIKVLNQLTEITQGITEGEEPS